MNQNLDLPQQLKDKDSNNVNINKELAIKNYKEFYLGKLQSDSNRTKALRGLEQLMNKHSECADINLGTYKVKAQ